MADTNLVRSHETVMSKVNLDRIQEWIDKKRIDPTKPITLKEITSSRAIHGIKDGIKLLARGAEMLKTPINIVVSRASQAAIAAVEAVGGTVTTRHYTPMAIRQIKQRKMHPYVSMKWDQAAIGISALITPGAEAIENRAAGMGYNYRLPDPIGRKELEYYRDAKNRGYLSHTVKEGEGPSLYFKPPKTEEEIKLLKRKSGKSKQAAQQKEAN